MIFPTYTIGEVCEFVLDGTHGSPARVESGIPVLSAQHVIDGKLNFETDRFTTEEEYKNYSRRFHLQKGDVLFTIVGTIGRSAVVSEVVPHVFQRSVAILRPKPKLISSEFLYHLTQSIAFKTKIDKFTNKSAQAGIYLGKLKEIDFNLPPLAEQQRIAALLDTADRILKQREFAIAKLENLIRSYFYEIVLKNSTKDQLFELGSVVELKYGKSLPSQNRRDGEFNVYGSNGVVGSHIESITNGETIIVGRKGSFGEINLSLDSCFPIDTTYYIDKSATKQNIVWLRYALETLKLNTLNKSAAVPGLNREDAYRQKLQLINRNLQNDFEVRIRKIWSLIKTQNDFIHKHKRLIASLQHQSFAVN